MANKEPVHKIAGYAHDQTGHTLIRMIERKISTQDVAQALNKPKKITRQSDDGTAVYWGYNNIGVLVDEIKKELLTVLIAGEDHLSDLIFNSNGWKERTQYVVPRKAKEPNRNGPVVVSYMEPPAPKFIASCFGPGGQTMDEYLARQRAFWEGKRS